MKIELKNAGALKRSIRLCGINMLVFAAVVCSSEQIVNPDVKDTTSWKLTFAEENKVPFTRTIDSSGVRISSEKRSEHEYDAGMGTVCSLKTNTTYTIVIKARSDSSDQVAAGFMHKGSPWFPYAMRTIKLSTIDSTYTLKWLSGNLDMFALPLSTVFTIKLGKIVGTVTISSISISGSPTKESDTNDFECPLKPKMDPIIGDPSALPDGYVVYCDKISNGTFVSNIRKWNPVKIKADTVYNLSLSDDGRWILYILGGRAYMSRIDGKYETSVPTPNPNSVAGFVRTSPYASEVFYDNSSGHNYLYANQITFFDSSVNFGSRRILAQIGPNWEFERYYRLLVSKDQIWGDVHPIINGVPHLRSGFLTIPDSGRGVATPDHIYKFKNDDMEQLWGCNHAMSHDGKYCLAIPGNFGETGDFCHCGPPSHAGFYITKFYRFDDTSVDIREHVHRYATSLNWCPREYRLGVWSELDFANYVFANDNQYVAATQNGTLSPRNGLWVIDWDKNIWYPISPDSCKIEATSIAMYIGAQNNALLSGIIPNLDTSSTVKPEDDPVGYKVIQPSGGELFHPGEQCTIKVVSKENGNASIKLQFGKNSFSLFSSAINPKVDSLLVVTIPEFFLSKKIRNGETVYDTIRPYSNACKIIVDHYIAGVAKSASSDGYFTISSSASVNSVVHSGLLKKQVRFSSISIASFLNNPAFSKCTGFSVYDCMGRTVIRWNRNSGTILPAELLSKFRHTYGFYLIKAEYLINKD